MLTVYSGVILTTYAAACPNTTPKPWATSRYALPRYSARSSPLRCASSPSTRRGNTARQEDEEAEPETRKLYRSRTDRSIAGICGGLADFFHVDATVMRLLMLFLIIFGGLSIWAYIILWIIIPEQPAPKFNINRKNR